MTLESRNAATMRSAQARYDNAAPPDDYDVTDVLTEDDYAKARAELLAEYDADDITDAMVADRASSNYESRWDNVSNQLTGSLPSRTANTALTQFYYLGNQFTHWPCGTTTSSNYEAKWNKERSR